MTSPLRVLIGAAGWPGHLFPALSVARELKRRGHTVLVQTFESWRETVDELGFEFAPEAEEVVFPGPAPPGSPVPSLADAARASVPAIERFAPDVALHDLYTLVPALAADVAGVPRATMMPHPFPEPAAAEPPFSWGLLPPRTALGARLWRFTRGVVETRPRRQGKVLLDRIRAELGLAPLGEQNMMLSESLTMVATFPQLEYPRRWPAYMHVTGPPVFEFPNPRIELPPGDDPLVLVAASTRQDPRLALIRYALDAFRGHPVRVVASTNRPGEPWTEEVPANAVVTDWVSYSQVLPEAAAVICRGGHGTLVRSLAAGVPLVVCPSGGDMGENAARVAWAGAGVMLPRRLLAPRPLRLATQRVLGEPRFADRAGEIAAWAREHDGAVRIADLLESFVANGSPLEQPQSR